MSPIRQFKEYCQVKEVEGIDVSYKMGEFDNLEISVKIYVKGYCR